MPYRPVSPGTPVRQAVTARLLNDLTSSTPAPQKVGSPLGLVNVQTEVLGQLRSSVPDGTVIEPYTPVLLGLPLSVNKTDYLHSQFMFEIDRPVDYNYSTHGPLPDWGVAQERITKQRAGRILMTGMTWFKSDSVGNYSDALLYTYRNVDVIEGAITFGYTGRGEIVGNYQGVGNIDYVILNLSQRYRAGLHFETKAGGLPAGGRANCYYVRPYHTPAGSWETLMPAEVLVYNPNRTVAIPGSKRGIAVDVEGRWVAVFAECA